MYSASNNNSQIGPMMVM